MDHLTRQELEAFVSGTAPRDPDALRRHIAACPTCARQLSQEARLELLLQDALLERTQRPIPPRLGASETHVWLRPLAIAATLLVVAGTLWNLTHREDASRLSSAEPSPVESVADVHTPRHPMAAMPGSDVVSPTDLCRHVSVPAGSVPGL